MWTLGLPLALAPVGCAALTGGPAGVGVGSETGVVCLWGLRCYSMLLAVCRMRRWAVAYVVATVFESMLSLRGGWD